MLSLGSPVTDIKGIGPAKAKVLQNLGITQVRHFLFHFPHRHQDFSKITPIAELKEGEECTVCGKVTNSASKWGFQGRRRLLRVFADIQDDTGSMHAIWFNLRYLGDQLTTGRQIYVAGVAEKDQKGQWRMRSPAIEFADLSERTHTGAITPVYSETKGVTSRFLRYHIKQLLPLVAHVPEYIPEEIRQRHQLIGIQEAITAIHFPANSEQKEAAARRLRFDELFFLQLSALVRRQSLQKAAAPPISHAKALQKGIESLPFALTGAQQEALKDIQKDVAQPHPMNRLLQGDVGSGKSAVALLSTIIVLESGYSVAYLAPTEILARQQAHSFRRALKKYDVELLIGALTVKDKKRIKEKLTQSQEICVIGTHALLQEDTFFSNLGLVVIDEQHRFGVAQRAIITQRENEKGERPHLLSMTATPIPRTLNLTVYGDLDVSIIDELPAGRQPIKTKVIPPAQRDTAIVHTLQEIHDGRQAYVIAPLVEQSDRLEAKSAKETYEEMQQLFPGIAIGLLHGQLPASEKERIMSHFAAGAIQLLVSTSVVEVGVDVPNATVMIIEGAERFGLAQLHQFRGRIGRGEYQSYCYLFPTSDTAANARRLQILSQTTDGFKIAEEDLKLRGPGEIYGTVQSGYANLKVASLLDYPTIKIARAEAESILQEDPDLKNHDILRRKVEQKNLQTHFE